MSDRWQVVAVRTYMVSLVPIYKSTVVVLFTSLSFCRDTMNLWLVGAMVEYEVYDQRSNRISRSKIRLHCHTITAVEVERLRVTEDRDKSDDRDDHDENAHKMRCM